jgi:hypothetical protein
VEIRRARYAYFIARFDTDVLTLINSGLSMRVENVSGSLLTITRLLTITLENAPLGLKMHRNRL